MMNEIEPIAREDTLADKAYDRLRSALMTGSFKAGDTLSIRGLAGILGISATPARDAISRVLWERGLESGPNRTVIVPKLTTSGLEEIYDVRLNLEGQAGWLAASRFTRNDLNRLETLRNAHLQAVNARDYKRALIENEKFHFAIYERSGNATLVEIIRGLWLRLGPSLNLLYPTYALNRKGVDRHAQIVDAMRKKVPKLARSGIEDDLKDGCAELKRAIAKSELGSTPATAA
jgi:DNA-binding GntR family transcriptional regulator